MLNRSANNSGQGTSQANGQTNGNTNGYTNGYTNGHGSRGASPDQANEIREFLRGADSAPVLNSLIELISNGDQQAISRVISVIRSGASQAQILDTINQINPQNGA